jgi:hypothetical protein
VVIVTRPTEYDGLLAEHATHGQAAWVLGTRGQAIGRYVARHQQQRMAVDVALRAIPSTWRHTSIGRADLDRFLFTPDDVVVAVGQDGLVANVAKYLEGQPVIGVNPDPARYEGVLARHPSAAVADLLRSLSNLPISERTMVVATTDTGLSIRALNEVFIGHATHQSARYRLTHRDAVEDHSSSGVIIATGTGATGWARSVHRCHQSRLVLPEPCDPELVFFVREAWPSVATGAELTEGIVASDGTLTVTSAMNGGGTVFGDGIEGDALPLPWGASVHIARAPMTLRLVA